MSLPTLHSFRMNHYFIYHDKFSSFNWFHEYLYSKCAAGSSILWLKNVIISLIVSGLVLFFRVNPNLLNFFFNVLNEIFRLWYAAKNLLLWHMERSGEVINNGEFLIRWLFWSSFWTEVVDSFNCCSFTLKT